MTIYGIAAMCIFFLTFAMQPDELEAICVYFAGDIEICFIWIPIVLCVLIAVLTYFYKLDSIRGEMTEELEKRR